MKIIKHGGKVENFSKKKLIDSLLKSGATSILAKDILTQLEKDIKDNVSSDQIYKKAFNLLKKKSKAAAMKYSIKRSIMDLGPTGFPFEDYIASLFKAKGFDIMQGNMVKGLCIEHEIDVIAYDQDNLILTEVKFHNDNNVKSDTKVALYVKARFDDLKDAELKIRGTKRKMTRGILITNTRFTDNAIKYGKCVGGFDMISWDYPERGNLFELIEETRLHPMTCILGLSKSDKMKILEHGIVTCEGLKKNKSVLNKIGLSDSKIQNIIRDIDKICN